MLITRRSLAKAAAGLTFAALSVLATAFEGAGDHEFEITYHIHPDTTINEEMGWWMCT